MLFRYQYLLGTTGVALVVSLLYAMVELRIDVDPRSVVFFTTESRTEVFATNWNLIRYLDAMGKPWIIAHRGASGYAPENTLAAFERADELGAGFIETDIRMTSDARFIAMHDEMLDRTTNGRGEVQQHTLAELQELDTGQWFDREFRGQRIP